MNASRFTIVVDNTTEVMAAGGKDGSRDDRVYVDRACARACDDAAHDDTARVDVAYSARARDDRAHDNAAHGTINDSANEHLLFNTASGAFAVLNDAAWAEYTNSDNPHLPVLEENGLLTSLLPQEELQALRDRLADARKREQTLRISLVPTYACNFQCPYCYERGHSNIKGIMDETVMDAVMLFIEQQFSLRAQAPEANFTALSVQWYGGDPSLALDEVAQLSKRMIAWCEQQDIAYDALMLTNANVIDEEQAQLIADCRISKVFLTIDGPHDLHNSRRVAANGTDSYDRTIQAARYLRTRGIVLEATMNVDKVSWPWYAPLRDKLLAEEGIVLSAGRLCDYAGTYGVAPYAAPDFDLFTLEEFAQAQYDLFASEAHSVEDFRSYLMPSERFCSGQSGAYFVIDFKGDVYHCDGWVGDASFVRFNICDNPSTWHASEITFDATQDEKCSQCDQLPLCLGSCIWERTQTGMPCYQLKHTLPAYIRLYRACFGDITEQLIEGNGVALLAKPFETLGVSNYGA